MISVSTLITVIIIGFISGHTVGLIFRAINKE